MKKLIVVCTVVVLSMTEISCDTNNSDIIVPDTPSKPVQTLGVDPCTIQSPIEGQSNLFHNPGFEEGTKPWCVIHPPMFEISDEVAHTGRYSAHLHMNDPADTTGVKIYYLVQEVSVSEFPEVISGYYRVDKWDKGTPDQYLQFVVVVFNAKNRPFDFVSNHQIRYPLAGIEEDPFTISNAHFQYIGTEEPPLGEWVYFDRNIQEDFQQLWGAVPQGFSHIRFLFEVRYDNKMTGTPVEAEVYYDDLYVGFADDNPNRPK